MMLVVGSLLTVVAVVWLVVNRGLQRDAQTDIESPHIYSPLSRSVNPDAGHMNRIDARARLENLTGQRPYIYAMFVGGDLLIFVHIFFR